MIHLDVHRPVYGGDDGLSVTAVVFVTLFDRLCLPIGPIDGIFEHGQGEDVMQTCVRVVASVQNNPRIATLQISHSDVIFSGVGPKHFIRLVGYSQCIRPAWIFKKQNYNNEKGKFKVQTSHLKMC